MRHRLVYEGHEVLADPHPRPCELRVRMARGGERRDGQHEAEDRGRANGAFTRARRSPAAGERVFFRRACTTKKHILGALLLRSESFQMAPRPQSGTTLNAHFTNFIIFMIHQPMPMFAATQPPRRFMPNWYGLQ